MVRDAAIGDFDLAFVEVDFGIVVIDEEVEDGAADGDDGGGGIDAIGVGPAAEFFDLDTGFALDDVEEVARGLAQVIDLNSRFRGDDSLGTVGEAQDEATVLAGDNGVPHSQYILDFKGDGLQHGLAGGLAANFDLTLDGQDLGREGFLGRDADRQ